jgi:hypothetical protein
VRRQGLPELMIIGVSGEDERVASEYAAADNCSAAHGD